MVPLFSMMTPSTNTKSPLRKNAVLFGNGLIRTLGSPSSIDLLKERMRIEALLKREIEELPEAYIIPVAEYLATQEEATNE